MITNRNILIQKIYKYRILYLYELLSFCSLTRKYKSDAGFPSIMDSAIGKALERFDKNKPILKCDNCGFWKNIEKTDIILFEKLGSYSCMNCGNKIRS